MSQKLLKGGPSLARGLQLLGMAGLGMGGGFERLHYLLESAFDPDGHLSITFLRVGQALHSSSGET